MIDEKLKIIPPIFNTNFEKKDGKDYIVGFSLRFSTDYNKWKAGYGLRSNKFSGFGKTPEEAIDNFIKLAKNCFTNK